jgi:hypothetical protein
MCTITEYSLKLHIVKLTFQLIAAASLNTVLPGGALRQGEYYPASPSRMDTRLDTAQQLRLAASARLGSTRSAGVCPQAERSECIASVNQTPATWLQQSIYPSFPSVRERRTSLRPLTVPRRLLNCNLQSKLSSGSGYTERQSFSGVQRTCRG